MRQGQLLNPGDDRPRADVPEAYSGPPPTASHDPGAQPLPADPYLYPAPYPYGYPGSPYPGSPYPGAPYPPAGYPPPGGYGYPKPEPGSNRPGSMTAAAVLGYISAGLLFVAAMLVFFGASIVASVDNSDSGLDLDRYTAELTVDGLLNLIAGGLLIAGGVTMTARRASGRSLYSAGAAVVVAESAYWLLRWGTLVDDVGGMVFYALLFATLALVGLSLAWTRNDTRWLGGAPPVF